MKLSAHSLHRLTRLLSLAGLLLGGVNGFAATKLPAKVAHELTQTVQPFFAKHCTSCHGEQKQKGDLRVDTLAVDYDSSKVMGHWEEIMNRLNSGDMPPAKEPRPKPADLARVGEWIASQLNEAEVARQAAGERVAFRKLSRAEYGNTIRDLPHLSAMTATVQAPAEWIESIGEFRLPPQPDRHLQSLMDRNTEGLLQSSEKEELAALAALSEEISLLRAQALQLLGCPPAGSGG